MAKAHVASWKLYIFIFLALCVLTVATVAASEVDLGHTENIVLALAIATFKVLLVGLFFMHLKHDAVEDLSIRYFVIFPIILFFILVFALMPDVGFRISDHAPGERPALQAPAADDADSHH